ncbi:uncharacterized protein LOC133907239 [Phragmites australis]|uniref:uncharacterized protein LOC133907239 n=1 Tax=Phragmites australis TaxID=29695 RepID=UPI002D769C85|nr:uncharacterized protein LOC133907239 [Phragmites australis]
MASGCATSNCVKAGKTDDDGGCWIWPRGSRIRRIQRDGDEPDEELPIVCAAKKGWKNVVKTLLIHTNEIPGVEWSVEGIIQYVNSEQFKETNRVEREIRVDVLKKRLLRELELKNYLAADLICKALHVDMDTEHWDWYHSICSILLMYGLRSTFLECNAETIHYIGMGMFKQNHDEIALLAAKACMALDPDNESCKAFHFLVKEKMNRAASGSR